MPESDDPLLAVRDLRVRFEVRRGVTRARQTLTAVDGVCFDIKRGTTLGLVGESGCGKTTLARAILRLIPVAGGQVLFEGRDVLNLPPRELQRLRRRMQIVFQDPIGSLNPRLRIETIVGEALTAHRLVRSSAERRHRVAALLSRVGLSPDDLDRYPHAFSGGQRQRIGISRALALEPSLIICDEPTSALDVSIQAQILNLLADLQRDLGVSYLFIAHNLAVVRHISDEVAVMYLGRIVEYAPTEALFEAPRHPYTQALLAAASEDQGARFSADRNGAIGHQQPLLIDEPPSPSNPPSGCTFHPRCPFAKPRCCHESPPLRPSPGAVEMHAVACHRAEEIHEAQMSRTPR